MDMNIISFDWLDLLADKLERMNALPVMFVLSIISIGISFVVPLGGLYIKVYPLCFALFIGLYCIQKRTFPKKSSLLVLLFLVFSVSASIFNYTNTFHLVSFVKLVLNLVYLLCAISYLRIIKVDQALYFYKIASAAFIFLSFVQIFYIVFDRSLWMMPFGLQRSSDSYVISQAIIYFGDVSKNIFAAKVSIFMMLNIMCHYVYCRIDAQFCFVMLLGGFTLLYVSSRTAQLSLFVFLGTLIFYHLWFVYRKRFLLVCAALLIMPLFFYIAQLVLRIDIYTIINFNPSHSLRNHGGDGLLSRLILWDFIFQNVEFSQFVKGHGIFSFEFVTGGVFTEDHPHNVFLSIALDFGLFALFVYLVSLGFLFFRGTLTLVFLPPFLIFANSQSMGYDTELVVLFSFVFLIGCFRHIENHDFLFMKLSKSARVF